MIKKKGIILIEEDKISIWGFELERKEGEYFATASNEIFEWAKDELQKKIIENEILFGLKDKKEKKAE